MSVFKGNLAEQTVFIRIERSRPEAIDGIIVQNNPINKIDPYGLSWRSVALGATSATLNTAALATIWNPPVAGFFKTAGGIATLGSLANAYYENKTGQISDSDLASTALQEAGNLVGGKLAGKFLGTAGEIFFSGLTRSVGVAGTTIDAVKTFSSSNSECNK